MPHVTLKTEQGWRGQVYPAGPAFIPDDLAIALGLTGIPVTEQGKSELAEATERLDELKRIYDAEGKRDWAAIKEIGDRVGARKHPDGWDSSFLRIIEKEFSAEIAKAIAEAE